MGELVRETPYSEITATLEVLDNLGVRRGHLGRIRSERDLAKDVAALLIGNSVQIKSDWFTFDNPGRSLIQMRDANPSLVWQDTWYEGQNFVSIATPEETQIQFQIPGSNNKSSRDQEKLLGLGESFPTSQQAVAGLLAYHERYHLFPIEEGVWIRTSSVASNGRHVVAKVYGGRVFVHCWFDLPIPHVFAARVLNS